MNSATFLKSRAQGCRDNTVFENSSEFKPFFLSPMHGRSVTKKAFLFLPSVPQSGWLGGRIINDLFSSLGFYVFSKFSLMRYFIFIMKTQTFFFH